MISQQQDASVLTSNVLASAAFQRGTKVSVESDFAAPDDAPSSMGGSGERRRVNHQHFPKPADRFTEQGPYEELSTGSGSTLGLHGFARLNPGSPA